MSVSSFKPGDRVICVSAANSLVSGEVYTIAHVDEDEWEKQAFVVIEELKGRCDRYFANRFKKVGESMKVRAHDDWRPGDKAYCIESLQCARAGDIRKVRRVGDTSGDLYFGEYDNTGELCKCYARVLTPDEIRALPVGSKIVNVRGGNRLTVTYAESLSAGLLTYALISLPEVDEKVAEAEKRLEAAQEELRAAQKLLKGVKR